MRKLRDAQHPDFKNHKIPAAATDGSVMWARLDKLRVMGHMIVVQHHQDIASDILPVCPCPLSYDPGLNYVTPETLDLLLGETLDFTFYGAFQDCNQNIYYYDEDELADWTSEYPDMATVNSSGAVTGQSSGTTQITAEFSDYDYTYNSLCPETLVPGGGGTANVLTVSVSCTNEHLALGTGSPGAYTGTNTGTCTATPSFSGGTYSWASNKNTVSLSGNTSATVTYSSSNPSTAMGDTILTVTYTLNGQAPTASSPGITVHKPTSLVVAQDITQDGTDTQSITCAGTYACPDAYGSCPCTYGSGLCSQTGPVFIRLYSVQDQLSPPNQFGQVGIAYTNNAEAFTSINSTCCNDKPTPSLPASSSQFGDKFELLNTRCFSGQPGCQETIGQTITVNGSPVRTDTITKTCTSAKVTP